MHGRDVIHADLKPANILIDASGNARVSDFGESMERRDASSFATSTSLRVARGLYMDPYLLVEGISIKKHCDEHSWAMVVWEVLVVEPSFRGVASESVHGLNRRLLAGERPDTAA